MMPDNKYVLIEDIRQLLGEILGEDFSHEEVNIGTSLIYDLGLESLEFIAVLDAIYQKYGVLVQITSDDGEIDPDIVDKVTVGYIVEKLM